jgi:hypothetical protein
MPPLPSPLFCVVSSKVIHTNNYICAVTEFASKGSLYDHLQMNWPLKSEEVLAKHEMNLYTHHSSLHNLADTIFPLRTRTRHDHNIKYTHTNIKMYSIFLEAVSAVGHCHINCKVCLRSISTRHILLRYSLCQNFQL